MMWRQGRKRMVSGGRDYDSDRLAEKIAFGLLSCQRSLADQLNQRLRRIPVRVLLVVLITCGLAFGTYCCLLIINAFF